MNREISLIGTGQTRFGEFWDKNLKDLMQEAIDAAITSSPCPALDVDMIIVANMLGETTNQQAHLGALASSILPHHPPALRVEAACASGSVAVHTACALLESNRAETVLVVGVEKMTDASVDAITEALMGAADSEEDRPAGLTFPAIFGLVAQRYMHEYGLTREQLNIVSAVHHKQAAANPFAQFRNLLKPESISRSPLIADPLHLLDCSPVSDGAAAVLLSTKHASPMRLAASQLSTDTLSLTQRPTITSFAASREAGNSALQEADIDREEIGCLELHDCFSIAALLSLEDLGFAEPGNGIEMYEGLWNGSRNFLVNASGGLKACGHPVAATGIKQIIDVSKQLKAHNKQWGMAHNFGGAGSTCCVNILQNTNNE